jgi:hypothetical protein
VPGVILGVVIFKGAFGDFWKSYILASAAYATQESFLVKLTNVYDLLVYSPEFTAYMTSAIAAVLLLLIFRQGKSAKIGANLAVPFILILLEMFVTLFCIFAAGKRFLHYDFLLVPPLAILFGLACLCFGKILEPPGQSGSHVQRPVGRKLAAICVVVIALQFLNVPTFLRGAKTFVRMHDVFPMSAVAKSARAATSPGESMSIWGWMPGYYVESGLCPATRDAVGHYIISPGPYQEYFRSRYLRDLERSRPVVFVDVVASGMFVWNWTPQDGHESFPALAKFIDENYSLWMTISFGDGGERDVPVRLYVLKERMAERKLIPEHLKIPQP